MSAEPPVRVLLIEDDPGVAHVNAALIGAEQGFEVVGVADGVREGLRLARLLHPELLLVDIYLPDGSGLEVLRALRVSGEPFEALMITAANDVLHVQQALQLGAFDYLIKPFRRARLQGALEQFRVRRLLHGRDLPLTQLGLDRLLGHAGERPPKGIDALTLEAVQRVLLAARQALSAEEVGERLGLSRTSAWRYLEFLTERGFAVAEAVYGGVGRPTKRYRVGG